MTDEESLQNLLFFSSLGSLNKDLNVPTIKPVRGEFPINGWKQYPLEIPRDGCKRSITGRSFHAFGLAVEEPSWYLNRTIKLPLYPDSLLKLIEKDNEILRELIQKWKFSHAFDEIPVLTIAAGVAGCYCDFREFQTVAVLPIWHDSVGRILELNWAEGPLEDCVSPEWYLKSTPLLGLEKAIEKAKRFCDQELIWEDLSFFIHMTPSFMGNSLRGERSKCDIWHEWKYNQYSEWKEDLNFIFSNVLEVFYGEYKIKSE
jgi:hypothetical protein